MNSSQSQNIALIILVFFGFDVHIVTSKHRTSRVPVHLSSDFMNFLHNLGSRVYTVKTRKRVGADHGVEVTTKNNEVFSTRNIETWTSETNFGIQKDALRDALMMKLVSYYEDKYKLSDSQRPTTTTTAATALPFRRNVRLVETRSRNIHPLSTKTHITHARPVLRHTSAFKVNLVPDVEVI